MEKQFIPKNAAQQCNACKDHIPYTVTCKAFPKGIPLEIRRGNWDHRQAYPGDSGILYEPKDPSGIVPALHPKNKVQ